MGARDLSSGLNAYAASILLTEPSPQFYKQNDSYTLSITEIHKTQRSNCIYTLVL